ncbi:MAG: transporter substrate-binding domain-containing protein [Gammaproteobacteria bacterium]|nr:transporter substrate-binding domain-containing protein [Gammaproteobacteria bacterium]
MNVNQQACVKTAVGSASICLWLAGVFLLLITSSPSWGEERYRVGIYHNPPLSLVTPGQPPQGFIVDILNDLAQRQQWQLDYVPCQWSDCLAKLNADEVDLLSPIAYSPERATQFDFNKENLFTNWAQVVASKETRIDSMLDLNDKTIVVLKGDIHQQALRKLIEKFDIKSRFLEVDSYQDVVIWTAYGPADVGLLNRSSGDLHDYRLSTGTQTYPL